MPIVAIVGRANVGKSSLFNSVLARRETIVAREPGTTRDSISAKATWRHQNFWIVDTAGMKNPEDEFELTIQQQIVEAANNADVIWVIVEANAPVSDEDRKVAKLALRSKKPVTLVINKVDKAKNKELYEFQKLGIKATFHTSTTQNQGIDELLDNLIKQIPKVKVNDYPNKLKIALVGRPNVGKSRLFNELAKKQQAIVADRAGTTRDINRTQVRFHAREIELLDTAGIRRPGKVDRGIEYFSVLRSLSAIEESDVAVLLMDVSELNVALDQKIAGMVKDAGKGLILAVSKWDSLDDKTAYSRDQIAPQIVRNYDFVPWAPLVFTSAVTGQNVTNIFELANEIYERRQQKIPTTKLNTWLRRTIDKHPPAGLKNRNPKLNYMTQETENSIPSFKIFGSNTKFVHWSYRRFLEKQLRDNYDFVGTALQLWLIEKHEAHKHGNSPTKKPRN